ncbi:MAG: methylenetetrahydrofolate reductase [Chloroflexi bacterium]|nr:methylenetetrahydrofolate reductase [Chloroflexota bacterium]
MDEQYTSRLEQALRTTHFAVTAELGPPKNADAEVIRAKGDLLRHCADALNITDNQTAIVRMSSIAGAQLLMQQGIEPVIQMTCRDRNRIAMQSDLLGAHALGVRNVLCLTGDHMVGGNHPEARKVFDLDSVNLVAMVRGLNEGKFQCGEELKPAPRFFIGAVENPFAPPYEFRPHRLKKKIDAGAQFIQTQMIFNVTRFKDFMAHVCELDLHERAFILAGVGPLKSPGMARYMRDNVAGMEMPDELVKRMEGTPKDKWRAEGINICVEIIEQMKDIAGIAGVHIMSIEWEEAVPRIAAQAKLLPRPHELETEDVAQPALH